MKDDGVWSLIIIASVLLLADSVSTWLTVLAVVLGAITQTTDWGQKNKNVLVLVMAGLMIVDLLGTKYGFLPEFLSWA